MSTFLQLCQDVRRECRVPGSGPTTVLNQTGDLDRIVNWVKNVWTDLQNEQPNWRWMRGNFTVQTTANLDTYAYSDAGVTDADSAAAITRWARWWTDEFQIYLTSSGVASQGPIPFQPWELWRPMWRSGQQNAGYPSAASIDPQDRLRLGAKPNGIYTFTGEYQKGPQTLAADGDIPEMPTRFHQIIVARAMKRWAASKGASEVWSHADDIEAPLVFDLQVSQKPQPTFGNALC